MLLGLRAEENSPGKGTGDLWLVSGPNSTINGLRVPERVIYGQGQVKVTIRIKFITSSSITLSKFSNVSFIFFFYICIVPLFFLIYFFYLNLYLNLE